MFFGSLAFIFEVMIYVGLGLPLVNVLLGLIGGALQGGAQADADLPDAGAELAELDLGGTELSADLDMDFSPDLDADFAAGGGEIDIGEAGADAPDAGGLSGGARGFSLRFNLYCLCLALVVMGAVGIFALQSLSGAAQVFTLIGGAVLALAAYVLLFRFVILPLKRNDAHALNVNSLRYRHARVTFRIAPDSPGTIQTRDAVGAIISYRAEIDPDMTQRQRIEEGEEVVITDLDPKQNLCLVAPAKRKYLDA